MSELREDGYPCKDCEVREYFAKCFDIHMSGEDCFYECKVYESYKANKLKESIE